MTDCSTGRPPSLSWALFETSADAVALIDERGILLRVNPALEEVFGYAAGELPGQKVDVLMPADLRPRHDQFLHDFIAGMARRRKGSISEIVGQRKNGDAVRLMISVSAVEEDGHVHILGVMHDLTARERREAEAQARLRREVEERTWELEQAYRTLQQEVEHHRRTSVRLDLVNKIVERSSQAVAITDHDNRIIYVNPAYEALTGFRRDQAMGQRPSISKSGRHGDDFYRTMWEALETDNHWEGEIWDRRGDGGIYPKFLSIDRVLDETGRPTNYVAMFHDLTEQKEAEEHLEQLERLHHYDPLTQLPNRFLFRERLRHEFDVAKRHEVSAGLLLLNVDRFRAINDSFGFAAGDRLLIDLAERLSSAVRSTDLVARQRNQRERDPDLVSHIGADDFAFILSELQQPEHASVVARRIYAALERPFTVQGQDVYLHCSMGIAVYPGNATTADGLMHCAERALQTAKDSGRDQYRFFSHEMNENSAARVRLETEMRGAVAAEAFVLHYQPKLDLRSGRLCGCEALIRWPRTDGTMVSPGDFIPLAEDTNLILPLGEWVLRQACLDALAVNRATGQSLSVAVNLSARQFAQQRLVTMVTEVLTRTGIDPTLVELEITEGMVMNDVGRAMETMQALRALGVGLSIDDFGTGYSSLSYLKNFPVSALKVDKSFVSDLSADGTDAAIVESVVGLGRSLGLDVIAEGVETAEQQEILRRLGCPVAQGYHICRPVPLAQYQAFVEGQDGQPG